MAKNITLLGASYSAVPAILLPQTGGGTARFDDASVTTATASDVASGKIFLASDGTITTGTASGGGGEVNIGTKTITNSDATETSLQFKDLLGEPKAFFVRCTTTLSRSSSYRHYYVATMRHNGTNTRGNRWYRYNGQFSNITSGYSFTYSNGTLTLTSSGTQTTSPGSFYNGDYELVYIS